MQCFILLCERSVACYYQGLSGNFEWISCHEYEKLHFCRQNNWHFWLANHRTSCRTSGAIQPKSEKLRYRTDNYYWVRPKANGERSIVTMGYSYYTMLHFISLWSVIWSVLVILIKTMGKFTRQILSNWICGAFSRKPWTHVSFSTKKIKITLLGLLDRLQKILDGQHCRFQ